MTLGQQFERGLEIGVLFLFDFVLKRELKRYVLFKYRFLINYSSRSTFTGFVRAAFKGFDLDE